MQYTANHPAVFSATLGLSPPWQVIEISFAKDGKRLDITIDFVHGSAFHCPRCGSERDCCTAAQETWFHSDFFRYPTYLHARVPKVACPRCGMYDVDRPWSRAGSKFILIQPGIVLPPASLPLVAE